MRIITFFSTCVVLLNLTYASEVSESEKAANILLKEFSQDNSHYLQKTPLGSFKAFADHQNPRVTVITCSDSRVQSCVFDEKPINNLFFVRNIGNQLETNLGSVAYGIHHLHTPVLFIIGHSGCGAVEAAMEDYSNEPSSIKNELHTLDFLKSFPDTNRGVIENVHRQVNLALNQFEAVIQKKQLVVIGAVYDFRNDFKCGTGHLIVININGEKDPAKIRELPVMKNIPISTLDYNLGKAEILPK